MPEPLIQIRDVNYAYTKEEDVLHDISMDIYPGEFVAFVGQNGAGKTTCAKLMNGILKPRTGEVVVDGQLTEEVAASVIARNVGYSYQNPDHQIWAMKVEDEIKFGPNNLSFSEAEVKEQVEEALELANLTDKRDEYTFALGWGERQKLAVASILAMRPKIIIVDEPTTGLDKDGSLRIMNLLQRLNKKGLTVVIITHDIDIVAAYANRVVVFAGGHIVRDDMVEEVMVDLDALEKADLRPPQHIRVALALKEYGVEVEMSPELLRENISNLLQKA